MAGSPFRRRPSLSGGSSEGVRADGAEASPQLLDAARERLLERWEELSAGWMAERAEASSAMNGIVETLCNADDDGSSNAPGDIERPLLHRRLVDALRIEVIGAWTGSSDEHDPVAVLSTLTRLEEYRGRLWPDSGEDVAARLAEPDAFELVVELAHDIRSPLNSILFLSEVLRSGHSGPINDHQRSQLGLVYSATLGMISVVSDVMELASERRGTDEEDPGPFSIAKVFDSVREMVRPMAEEKGIELAFELPDYDRYVGHPNQLGRVLLNLTTNALKFTESGTVAVTAARVGRTDMEISVQDTGRGIPPEELERLYQPFRKSGYRSGYFFSGSGLGLSIARRLVRGMDSELQVETEVGVGTRFFFRLELPPATSA